jgi:hypothetical protein
MVRDGTIAPPSRYKRLLAIFERLVHRISLSLSDLGGSSSVLLELEDLKLRLSDASLAAVAKMRAGTVGAARVIGRRGERLEPGVERRAVCPRRVSLRDNHAAAAKPILHHCLLLAPS